MARNISIKHQKENTVTKKEIQQKFEAHEKHLHALAWRCSLRNGHRTEAEAFQQACYLFMQACQSYCEDKGAFPSYIQMIVWQGLVRWSLKNDCPPDPDTIPESVFTAPKYLRPDRALMFKDWLDNLTDECKEVAMIILNGPAEILELVPGEGSVGVLGKLKKYLRGQGWSYPKIWETMKMMKMEVESL